MHLGLTAESQRVGTSDGPRRDSAMICDLRPYRNVEPYYTRRARELAEVVTTGAFAQTGRPSKRRSAKPSRTAWSSGLAEGERRAPRPGRTEVRKAAIYRDRGRISRGIEAGHCGIDGTKLPANKAFSKSCGITAGHAKSRRSFTPIVATEHAHLQDVFSGSDGTRTRDLRRDRCDQTVSAGFA